MARDSLVDIRKVSGSDRSFAVAGPQCDRKRVLLVDDEESIRTLFQIILSAQLPDRTFDVASNGAEAVESFIRGHHAVLLMDLHMPVMDGQIAFAEIERICRKIGLQAKMLVRAALPKWHDVR